MRVSKKITVFVLVLACLFGTAVPGFAAAVGDIDADGRITPADARLCLRAAVGLEALSAAARTRADADGDGKIQPADARLILRASVGLAQAGADGRLKEIELPPKEEPLPPLKNNLKLLDALLIYDDAGYEYYHFVQSTADAYVRAVNAAGAKFRGKATVYDIIIPTSIDITLDPRIRERVSVSDQQAAIRYMESAMSRDVKVVSIFDTMKAHKNEYIYFRTDHHWTGLGAYYAYKRFCETKGVAPVRLSDCIRRSFDGFYGTFYFDSGRNADLAAHPDRVDTYMPPVNTYFWLTESNGNTRKGIPVIYNADTSAAGNKYGAFIWGDNPISVIENTDMKSGESCLMVKESFGNAMAPLLAYNYKYVYIVDYRYYKGTIADLVSRYGISDVIYCNNISMTRASYLVSSMANRLG